jgi:hypothetical protein
LQLPLSQLQQLQSLTCHSVVLQEQQPYRSSSRDSMAMQQQGSASSSSSSSSIHSYSIGGSNTISSSSSSSSSSSNVQHPLQVSLSCLTSLTALELQGVSFGYNGGVAALTALTRLQKLKLLHVQQPQQDDHGQQPLGSLSSLAQLTELDLSAALLCGAAAGVFSGMRQLQNLNICGGRLASLDLLEGLPHSITHMDLGVTFPEPFGVVTVPALAQLSALRYLMVYAVGSYNRPLLEQDSSIRCGFLARPQLAATLTVLKLFGRFGSGMMRDLLDALPRYTCLYFVHITSYDQISSDMPQALSDVARYSALLPPSPTLMQFELTCWRASVLPLGCGEHLFAGPPRPSLKVLQLGAVTVTDVPDGSSRSSFEYKYFYDVAHAGIVTPDACFGAGDVERLVRCCPGLERLWMPGLVQAGVDVSGLLQLTALTGLFVGGAVWDDAVVESVLAGMTGLRQLELCDAPGLTDEGLLALAALTNLTQLRVLHCGLSDAMPRYADGRMCSAGEDGYFTAAQEVCGQGFQHMCLLATQHAAWRCSCKHAGAA